MTADSTVLQKMSANWGWMLALGIILVLLGLAGLGATFVLTLATVTFFGFLFIIGGVTQLVEAVRLRETKSPWGGIIISLLYFVGGVIIVRNPLLASATFTLFIAWSLILIGISHAVVAFKLRGIGSWAWMLINGVVAVLLGIMILSRWPVSGLWVIGLFVAIELLLNGWSMIMLSLVANKAGKVVN